MKFLLVLIFLLAIIELIGQLIQLILGFFSILKEKDILGIDKELYTNKKTKYLVLLFQFSTIISLILVYWLLLSNFPWAIYF